MATVIVALPAEAMRLAGTAAVTCVALTYVVVSGDPFHWTTAPDTKPAPFTARVNAGPPAVPAAGLKLVIESAAIGKVTEFDAAPPGLNTLMAAVPELAIRLAGTAAES